MDLVFNGLLILLKYSLLIVLIIGSILTLVFFDLLLFGSTVDPDDNGMLRTKAQKEKYRQKKLAKRSENAR